ncbi:hypothetical protein [Microbulbifer sp. ANSA005]|uniref:hypothetical protein n=1 Tax=Microbulbifer sp. ANSA005 TaxID=3243362 RepID=UPI004042B156
MNLVRIVGGIFLMAFASCTLAESTNVKGKIIFTEGHRVPNCRTVQLESNATKERLTFRIKDDEGSSDILSITLAALMGDREVLVTYDPEVTTGCGKDPQILYIRIH